jgi:hypothetical protein
MLFKCHGAENIWRNLRLGNMIEAVCLGDRSGADVLHVLLQSPTSNAPGYTSIHTHNLIVVASCYIWWMWHHQSRGEQVPPVRNCTTSICVITANASRSVNDMLRPTKTTWSKPVRNKLKLNADAAFVVEVQAGASGAIIRNNQGAFAATSSSFISHVSSPANKG